MTIRPPYGTKVRSRIDCGFRPMGGTIWIAAGPEAWAIARQWSRESWRMFLCVPDDERYDLGVVHGFDCVIWTNRHRISSSLPVQLIEHGATLALLVGDHWVSYRPSRKAA